MIGRVLHRLGLRDRLTALSRCQSRQSFIWALCESEIWILTALRNDGLDAETYTEEQLIDEMRQAGAILESDESLMPFFYEKEGRKRFPIFSRRKHMQSFCGEYSRERNRVFGFGGVSVAGHVIAQFVSECDEVVLNDKTPHARMLESRDMELLSKLQDRLRYR